MLGRRRRDSGRERGAVAVEFALVIPILLVVVFGIINLGFVFAQQIALSNGARQGARYATVDDRTCDQIITETTNGAETVGMTAAQVPTPTISPSCSGTQKPCTGTPAGTNVTVTMTRPASWAVPFPPLFTSGNAPTLVGKGIMRCEFQ